MKPDPLKKTFGTFLFIGESRFKLEDMKRKTFLSFVIPTYNAEKSIGRVLDSIRKQSYQARKIEIIVVDDNSTDKTVERVKEYQKIFPFLKVIIKDRTLKKGAAVSTNLGIRQSKGEFICLVDSDAILVKNWLKEILPKFKDKMVGMIAGMIKTANKDNLWAAIIGKELEDRYLNISGEEMDHLSTCNTSYRRKLFEEVGLFREDFYYGYDVDFSYRVRKKGYKILLAKKTHCLHYWKESFRGLLKQLYNTGYSRLQILEKKPDLKVGGRVSGWKLMAQVPLTIAFLLLLPASLLEIRLLYFDLALFALLFLGQLPQTVRIIKRDKDLRFLLFPLVMLLRNFVWVVALTRYAVSKSTQSLF